MILQPDGVVKDLCAEGQRCSSQLISFIFWNRIKNLFLNKSWLDWYDISREMNSSILNKTISELAVIETEWDNNKMEKIETEMVQDKQCHEETETWTEQILEKVKSHSCPKQLKRSGEILGKKSQQKLNHTSPKKYFKTLSQFT